MVNKAGREVLCIKREGLTMKEKFMLPDEIEREAILRYGKTNQTFMVFEEMSELQKEICKHIRGENNKYHIAEEIADVRIMLEQLRIMLDIDQGTIDFYYHGKLNRLKERMFNNPREGDET